MAACGLALFALGGCGGGSSNGTDAQAPTVAVASTPYTGHGWFVDAQAGDDAGRGSADSPWKTLARAGNQSLAAGDAVLLKCGGTWRESLTLAAANAPAGGAILGAWGDCSDANRPVVSGADRLSGVSWTVAARFGGKPVYVAKWPHPVSALYWNDTQLIRARYPNYGGIGHEFSLVESVPRAQTVVIAAADAVALSGVDLTGAKAYIRTNPWLVESSDVGSLDRSRAMTLNSPLKYTLQAGEGYFIEGSLGLLDAPGEWFYDTVSGQLYLWTPDGSSPDSGSVDTVTRDFGVALAGVADTQVDRIAFEKQAQVGLHITNAPRTLVTSLSSRYAGAYGILVDGTTADQSRDTSIQRSTITSAAVNGVNASSPGVEIVGNDIENTGVGASDSGVSAGVYLQSAGASVRDNRFANSAYAAILLANASGVTVSGNSLVQACRRFTDCGAVYSGGAPSDATLRTSVTSNAISDMAANAEGAVGGGNALVAGVYLDEYSANHDVVSNMIERVVVGINLHNSANHLLQSNQVWLADEASIRVHNSLATDLVRGNLIQDNELYASSDLLATVPATTAPSSHVAYAQEWVHTSDAALMFSGTNPNIVRRNSVGSVTAASAVRWVLISGLTPRVLRAAAWNAYATADSTRAAFSAQPFIVTSGGANLVQNGSFQMPQTAWTLLSASLLPGGTFTYDTCGTSGCADFTPGGSADFLASNTFQMSSTAGANLYQLQVRALAILSDSTLTMAINRQGGDRAQLGVVLTEQPIASAQETLFGTLFNATSSDPARLNMSGLTGKTVRLYDVTVAPVASYELLSPGSESELLTNASDAVKKVDCPTDRLRTCLASDLSGQAISWPVTLAAHSGMVVVSADAKWKP